jgi:site-specific DNA recombinase
VSLANRGAALEAEIKDTGDKLARLYRAIEEGVIDLDAQLKDRIATLKAARDLAQASLERIAEQARTSKALTPDRIDAFAALLQDKLATADTQARKVYLRTVNQEIRVDDHKIQIIGDKASLAAVIAGQQTAAGKVSGFVRKWRALRESNPSLQRERLPS